MLDRTNGSASPGTCAFAIIGYSPVNLHLSGTNVLTSGQSHAGLQVGAGNTVNISGGEMDMLTATNTIYGAAGIGCEWQIICGSITIKLNDLNVFKDVKFEDKAVIGIRRIESRKSCLYGLPWTTFYFHFGKTI